MAFQQSLGQMRAAVATYSALPLSGNTKGDIRITIDLGTAYTWISEASSGDWVSWKKVTVSNYNDLKNRPNSSPLAIDNATQTVRNLYLNYVYMFYMSMVSISMNVMKMFDGVLDALHTEDAIDLTRTSGQRRLIIPTMMSYAGYYVNDFDGSLDSYTKLLIHGYQLNSEATDFFDTLLNDILRNDTVATATNTKFGKKSLSFDASENSYLLLNSFYNNPGVGLFSNDGNAFKVNGVDFTWDMWIRCNADAAETIMVDHQFNHSDGTNFKIEKLADKTIKVSLRGCTDYTWDNQNVPVDPVSYDVTGTTTIEKEVWYHIGLVRQSGYLKLYINGILDGTSSVADTQGIIDYDNELVIGNENGFRLGQGFNGQIEEVRFSKGIARYTSTFTPRLTAYNDYIFGGMDAYTKAVLHCDGENNSTTFVDELGHTVTLSAHAYLSTTQKKFGDTSLFVNTDDSYEGIYITNSDDFDFGTGDFTIDMWIRPEVMTNMTFLSFKHVASGYGNFTINFYNNESRWRIGFYGGVTGYQWMTPAPTITAGQWNHIALTRESGTLKFYQNGILTGSVVTWGPALSLKSYSDIFIGSGVDNLGGCANTYIDEVRITKGVARWTSNFTPPTNAYRYDDNMIIQSEGYETNTIPSCARIVIFEQDGIIGYDPKVVQEVIPNEDIKVYISRDAGTTFTQVTDLKVEMDINQEVLWTSLYSNVNFLVGTVDLSSQPNGKEIVYKITIHNNKDLLIRSIALNWK